MGGSKSSSGGSEDREERKIPTYSDQLKKGVNINFGPEGSGRYKLTDSGLKKDPTALEKSIIGRGLNLFKDSKFNKENTIGLRKGFFESKKRTLDKRIDERTKTAERKMTSGEWDQERLDKFIGETTSLQSQRSGLDKTSFGVGKQSDDYWLSDAAKAELTAHGYKDYLSSRSAGGTGFDGRTSKGKGNNNQSILTKPKTTYVEGVGAAAVSPTKAEISQATATTMSADETLLATNKKGRTSNILTSATGLGGTNLNIKKKTLG